VSSSSVGTKSGPINIFPYADNISSRISKRINRPKITTERREDISNLIHKFGFEMPYYSVCFRANRPQYIVSKGKQRCDFYMSKKYTNCDFGGVTSQAYICLLAVG
jgi:hypothetical protein